VGGGRVYARVQLKECVDIGSEDVLALVKESRDILRTITELETEKNTYTKDEDIPKREPLNVKLRENREILRNRNCCILTGGSLTGHHAAPED